ncbi:hypothetical protein MFRU_013g00420 [Monilinia fructicola]|nr:hypothetical protein MFRU_013g00420 [Monilinia fructicola]
MVSSTWVGGGIGELAAANLYHTILNTNPPLLKPFCGGPATDTEHSAQ